MTRILYEDKKYLYMITYNEENELNIIDFDFKQTYLLDNVDLNVLTKQEFLKLLNEYFKDCIVDDGIETLIKNIQNSDFFKSLKDEIQDIKLKYYVMNAINNFTQWCGSFTFEKAFFKKGVVFLHFKEDEELTNFELYEYFKYMREKLINCLNNNFSDCWEKCNVERWNEYSYYILPVLRVLDDIENGKILYEKLK